MRVSWFLVGMIAFALGQGCQSAERPASGSPPNILLILADDLGYGDLGCYAPQSLVPTPHLDQLAAEGMRFTRAYCPVSVCSPTRYALMTGEYPWRSWKKTGVMANYEPSMIDSTLLTLPEMLQQAGYQTVGLGKWHLGSTFATLDGQKPVGYGKFRADENGANLDLTQPVTDGPLDHGFDHFWGFSCASECWIMNDREITAALDHDFYTIEATPGHERLERISLPEYLPRITGRTLEFLRSRTGSSPPFFLYFSPYVPHVPLAVEDDFQGSTAAGLYGDYVHELDHYLGQVLAALDSMGLKENTLVLFASDNGSQFEVTSNELDLAQAGNQRENFALPAGAPRHQPNGSLRGSKWSVYEGGVRTPFIARWPGNIPAGSTSAQLLALNDVMATLAAMTGQKLPPGAARDAHNLLPVWQGEEQSIRSEVVVKSSGKRYGMIRGNWKYVEPASPQSPAEGELYDLRADEGEEANLIAKHPEVARELKARLEALLGSKQSEP